MKCKHCERKLDHQDFWVRVGKEVTIELFCECAKCNKVYRMLMSAEQFSEYQESDPEPTEDFSKSLESESEQADEKEEVKEETE